MFFSSSRDRFVVSRTKLFILIGGLSSLCLLGMGVALLAVGATTGILLIILAVLNGAAFIYPFLCTPLGYALTEEELVITRRGRNVSIPLQEIKYVKAVTSKYAFDGALGGGTAHGLFGLIGHFYGSHIHEFNAYATRMDSLVLITRKDPGKGCDLIVSPDDRDTFISQVQSAQSKMKSD